MLTTYCSLLAKAFILLENIVCKLFANSNMYLALDELQLIKEIDTQQIIKKMK